MVPLKTTQILETLEEIKPLLKSDTRVHLLGIARPESFADFIKFGVTSIDSTTPLQQAFKDRKNNYHTPDGPAYTAVRVPQFDANPSLSRKIKSGVIDQDIARHLEKDAMNALFEYDKGALPLEKLLRQYWLMNACIQVKKRPIKSVRIMNAHWVNVPGNNVSAIFAKLSVSTSSFSAEQNVTVAAVSIIFRCCTTVYSTHCHYAQRNCHE